MEKSEQPGTEAPAKAPQTPEQKAAERRLVPVMQTLVDVAQFRLDLTNLLVEIGPGGFDAQEIHQRIAGHFAAVGNDLARDLTRIKRMLAFESLRSAGKLSAEGGATNDAIVEKMRFMDVTSRRLQREAPEPERSPPSPGPR